VVEMIDAVYRSHFEGSEVRLEPPLVNLPSTVRRHTMGRVA